MRSAKEFNHFCNFGHLLVTFSDASVAFFITFFARVLLPDSFCTRVINYKNKFLRVFRNLKGFCNPHIRMKSFFEEWRMNNAILANMINYSRFFEQENGSQYYTFNFWPLSCDRTSSTPPARIILQLENQIRSGPSPCLGSSTPPLPLNRSQFTLPGLCFQTPRPRTLSSIALW